MKLAAALAIAALLAGCGGTATHLSQASPTTGKRLMQARLAAKHDCSFINFTPNDCDESDQIPYCGRDGKTARL